MRARGHQEKLPGGGRTHDPSTTQDGDKQERMMNGSRRLPTGCATLCTSVCVCPPRAQQPAAGTIQHSPRLTDTYHRSLCLLRQVWLAPAAAGGRQEPLSAAVGHHHWAGPDSAAAAWSVGSLRRERWDTLRTGIPGRARRQGPAEELKAGLHAMRPWVSPSASWASVARSIG